MRWLTRLVASFLWTVIIVSWLGFYSDVTLGGWVVKIAVAFALTLFFDWLLGEDTPRPQEPR